MEYKVYEQIKQYLATLDISPQVYEDLIRAISEVLDI